ncbi:MAG TPA: hypothetical protein EYM33_00825 [Pseudomonadales bacterium]|nr:hypothetical protein [Pseudomonadales bacterium]
MVNAANTTLLGTGGVDGAIHRAAGPELLRECRQLGGCLTGEARITSAYRSQLARSFVPSVPYGTTAAPKSLNYCAAAMSIAFPTISTGAYGFPPNLAATIAVKTGQSNSRLDLVRFVCFDRATAEIYDELLSG